MAKLVMNFDTKEKSCACSIDGEAIGNLREMSVFSNYNEAGKYDFSISTFEDMNDDGMYKMMHYVSKGSAKAQEKERLGLTLPCKYDDFVKFEDYGSASEDISEYFKKK